MQQKRFTPRGFTFIELVVVIAIIGVLSSIIMFSASQYINRGKDSNVAGNLAVLIPAGEAFYNIANTYIGFCDAGSQALMNAWQQIPKPGVLSVCSLDASHAGLCCKVASDGTSWAACAQQFTETTKAYCVDSRGIKRQITVDACNAITSATIVACPEN